MIARRGKRLALKAAVDRLYLEAHELQHQPQLTASDDADSEVVGSPALQGAREAVEPAVGQLTGKVVALRSAARRVHQFFRRERRDLYAEQAAWHEVMA